MTHILGAPVGQSALRAAITKTANPQAQICG